MGPTAVSAVAPVSLFLSRRRCGGVAGRARPRHLCVVPVCLYHVVRLSSAQLLPCDRLSEGSARSRDLRRPLRSPRDDARAPPKGDRRTRSGASRRARGVGSDRGPTSSARSGHRARAHGVGILHRRRDRSVAEQLVESVGWARGCRSARELARCSRSKRASLEGRPRHLLRGVARPFSQGRGESRRIRRPIT